MHGKSPTARVCMVKATGTDGVYGFSGTSIGVFGQSPGMAMVYLVSALVAIGVYGEQQQEHWCRWRQPHWHRCAWQ